MDWKTLSGTSPVPGGMSTNIIVHISHGNIRPELLDDTADDGAAPDDGIGLILQKQVDGHDLDAGCG